MIIKWAKGNIRWLVLLVAIFSFTGIAIELTVRQYCVCFPCAFVGQPPAPSCHCTSLAGHYLRRALGHDDFDFYTNQNKDHRIQNNTSISQSQVPCSVGRVAHP
jgi:hypothetical protein